MHDLTQLNQELAKNGEERIILLEQIAESNRLNQYEAKRAYSNLIGKHFQLTSSVNCYKIIHISNKNCNDDVEVYVIFCTPTEVYKHTVFHNEKYVTEISLEQFETNLKQPFDNILNSKF